MKITGDLHIHSRFSRATSPKLTPPYLDRWARIKGIGLLGTGDCTHPKWLEILRNELDDAESGFYVLKKKIRQDFDQGVALAEELPNPRNDQMVRFVLTGEISTIYKYGERTRKVHHVVILPDFRAAAAFQVRLERTGNIRSDGRPILGMDSRDLLALLLDTDDRSELIPAHIWTPWFSAMGAKSGFDSIEECYRDLSPHIHAIETGLSSNPPMNWAVESLDKYSIVSNSDAHSPDKIGREATIFEMDLNYDSLKKSFSSKTGILGTIEFFPQEGKYHYEGHRNCGVCLEPEEAAERGSICPVCGKPFTPGVMSRVLELAGRAVDEKAPCPKNSRSNCRPYCSLIPLREILGELLGTGPASKKVDSAYRSLIEKAGLLSPQPEGSASGWGSEFSILMDYPLDEINKICPVENLAQAISRMRSGDVFISPGYDGEYGVIRTFAPGEAKNNDAGFLNDGFDSIFGGPSKIQGVKKSRKKNLTLAEKPPAYKGARKKPAPELPVRPAAVFSPDAIQKEIIGSNSKVCLVTAGPGTGKTAVIAAKIAGLIHGGADPVSILALSFTVKAAGELRDRVLRLLEDQVPPQAAAVQHALTSAARHAPAITPDTVPAVSTFHSLCASVLRENYGSAGLPENFRIIGDSERNEILEKICGIKSKQVSAGRQVSVRKLGDYIEEQKRFLLLPGENAADLASILQPPLHNLVKSYIPGKIRDPEKSEYAQNFSALKNFYSAYRDQLRGSGLVDYDGLIAGTARLLAQKKDILEFYRRKFRYIFVDEYQDLNFAQYVLVRLLAPGDINSLWVIGDPNQAIYGFRGSDRAFIDRFAEDYPHAHTFELRRSFRCGQPIIEAAGKLTGSDLEGVPDGGSAPVKLFRRQYTTEKSEAEGIARTIASLAGGTSFFAMDSGAAGDGEDGFSLHECAVLVRAAALAEPVIKALGDHGIPHEITEPVPWWEEEPARQMLQFLEERLLYSDVAGSRTISSAQDEITKAWKSVAEKGLFPGAASGKPGDRNQNTADMPEAVSRLLYLAGIFGGIRALLDGLSAGARSGLPEPAVPRGVKIMTIHASKGLEFDHVFLPALEEGILPFTLFDNRQDGGSQDYSEEKRLLYVAMTRARRGLWLSCAGSRFFRGRVLKSPPSRFLAELENIIPLMEEKNNKEKKPSVRDSQITLF